MASTPSGGRPSFEVRPCRAETRCRVQRFSEMLREIENPGIRQKSSGYRSHELRNQATRQTHNRHPLKTRRITAETASLGGSLDGEPVSRCPLLSSIQFNEDSTRGPLNRVELYKNR